MHIIVSESLYVVTTSGTFPSSTAEPGDDFIEQDSTITFPVGAMKGDVRCITVPIIDDVVEEGQEVFVVETDILSPSTAIFGGSLHSATGRIAVIIDDNC